MLHELVAGMAGHVPVATLAGTIHAYPTVSEAVRDAAVVLASRMR